MAWALAVALIFSSITLFFVFLYSTFGRAREEQDELGNFYMNDDEHKAIRIAFLGVVGTFILYLLGFIRSILSASKITDARLLSLFDSIAVVIQVIIYLFLAYLIMYVLYYLIHKVIKNSEKANRGLK